MRVVGSLKWRDFEGQIQDRVLLARGGQRTGMSIAISSCGF